MSITSGTKQPFFQLIVVFTICSFFLHPQKAYAQDPAQHVNLITSNFDELLKQKHMQEVYDQLSFDEQTALHNVYYNLQRIVNQSIEKAAQLCLEHAKLLEKINQQHIQLKLEINTNNIFELIPSANS